MTTTEEATKTAWEAYADLLGDIENPVHDKQVKVPGKYEFKYASLAAILKMCRPFLARHRFAMPQEVVTTDNGRIEVTTRLVWKDGTVVATSKMGQKVNDNIQQVGSQETYLRRYSIGPILGIAAEEDDDGGAASENGSQVYEKVSPLLVRPDQMDDLQLLALEVNLTVPVLVADLVDMLGQPFFLLGPERLSGALGAVRNGVLIVKNGHLVKAPKQQGK